MPNLQGTKNDASTYSGILKRLGDAALAFAEDIKTNRDAGGNNDLESVLSEIYQDIAAALRAKTAGDNALRATITHVQSRLDAIFPYIAINGYVEATADQAQAGYGFLAKVGQFSNGDTLAFTTATSRVEFSQAPTSTAEIFIRLPHGIDPNSVAVGHIRGGELVETFPRDDDGWSAIAPDTPDPDFDYYILQNEDFGANIGVSGIAAGDQFDMRVAASLNVGEIETNISANIALIEALKRTTKDLTYFPPTEAPSKNTDLSKGALRNLSNIFVNMTSNDWAAQIDAPPDGWVRGNDHMMIRLAADENPSDWEMRVYEGSDKSDIFSAGIQYAHLVNVDDLTGTEAGFKYYFFLIPTSYNQYPESVTSVQLWSLTHPTRFSGQLADGIVELASLSAELKSRLVGTPQQPSVSSQTNQPANAWVAVATQAITVRAGQKIMFWCSSSVEHESSDAAVFDARLVRDNAQILFENRASVGKGQVVLNFIDEPSEGDHTYKFELRCSAQGGNFVHPSMMILPIG